MDISSILAAKKAAAAATASELAPELQDLLEAIPSLEQKSSKSGEQFLALNLGFDGAELLSPFFGLAYALRTLPEAELLAAEEAGLFQAVRTKVSSWERGAITVSFFQKEAQAEEEAPKPKRDNNRGR